jgi:hypothetical protein
VGKPFCYAFSFLPISRREFDADCSFFDPIAVEGYGEWEKTGDMRKLSKREKII